MMLRTIQTFGVIRVSTATSRIGKTHPLSQINDVCVGGSLCGRVVHDVPLQAVNPSRRNR